MIIRQVNLSEKDAIISLLVSLHDKLSLEVLTERFNELMSNDNYRIFGAFLNDELVGVTGVHKGLHLWCGRFFYLDNVKSILKVCHLVQLHSELLR